MGINGEGMAILSERKAITSEGIAINGEEIIRWEDVALDRRLRSKCRRK